MERHGGAKKKANQAGEMILSIRPSTERGAKRRKNLLSVKDDIHFSAMGIHVTIFGESRGRCE
jgi:hypothetical protein